MNTEQTEFERLVGAHRGQVRAYCARRLPVSAVDDAVAEVFAVAWAKRSDLPTAGATLPWLYGVALRVVQHEWRRAGRHAGLVARATEAADLRALGADEESAIYEQRRLVLAAAARLSQDDQEILRLTLWEELTPTEAGVVLGISTDAAKQRAHRARRRLAVEFNRIAGTARPTGLDTGEAHR